MTALTNLVINSKDKITIGDNVQLTAGTLSKTAVAWDPHPAVPTLLGTKDIVTKGTLTLTAAGANGISFGNGNVLINNGAKLTVTALGANANMVMGDGNTFRDMGGNVVLLAKGTVTGGTGNKFESRSIVKTASGVEIGSGLTAGTLASANGKKGPLAPNKTQLGGNQTGTNITYDNNGVILINPKSLGTINLVNNGTNATLTAQPAGAIVFDAMTAGSKVQFDGATITVQAAKPIAQSAVDADVDYVVDTDEDDASVEVLTQK
jgi:hypothetical protein